MRARAVIAAVCMAVSAYCADPLEGVWQINGDGALLEFVQSDATVAALDIEWRDGPDLTIAPGTGIGRAVPSASAGVYDCHIATDPRASDASRRRAAYFKLTMHGADAFALTPYRRDRSISLWRWLPYLFRVTVTDRDNRPAELDGATRVGANPAFIVI